MCRARARGATRRRHDSRSLRCGYRNKVNAEPRAVGLLMSPAVIGFDMFDRARSDFERRLQLVTPADWPRPTPCPPWTVRDLVNHVVGGNWRYVALLAGAAGNAVKPGHDEDALGDDPFASFMTGADAVASAFRERGAMERVVHHRSGDMSGERLFVLRVAEFAIHGWDLAKSVGGDTAINVAVAEWLNDVLTPILPTLAQFGFYATAVAPLPSGATSQERLLHLVGREH